MPIEWTKSWGKESEREKFYMAETARGLRDRALWVFLIRRHTTALGYYRKAIFLRRELHTDTNLFASWFLCDVTLAGMIDVPVSQAQEAQVVLIVVALHTFDQTLLFPEPFQMGIK